MMKEMMRLRFDQILFDLDGTLTESGEGITNSVRHAFEKMGFPVPEQDILQKFIGPPLISAFMEYGGMTQEQGRQATERFRERFRTIGWMENKVYPGIPEMMLSLKAHGVRMAIASSKPLIFVERILKYFRLDGYFDVVAAVTEENTESDKTALLRRCIPEGADLSRIAMVGDRCFDIDAARNIGVFAVGAAYGYGSREELENSRADAVADTVRELREILLGDVPVRRGKFITFEGVDGCGKSTQMKKSAEYLRSRGWEVVESREPGGCDISERIRGILLDVGSAGMSPECEALLFAAARAEHVRSVILPALNSGKIVLCDRYLDSSIAYQACGRQLGEEYIRLINEKAVLDAVPDRTFLFDIRRDTARSRVETGETAPDRMEKEPDSFVGRVSDGFAKLAQRDRRIACIDANRTIEQISEDVLSNIAALLD